MLFRKKIDRYCTYCQFAGKIDDETMVCQFCGIVPSNHRCRRFRYDPLRRIPGRPSAPKPPPDDADFSLVARRIGVRRSASVVGRATLSARRFP